MSHPLDGVRAKLGRAEEHLHVLNEEVRRYGERRPYVPRVEPSPERDRGTEHDPVFLVVADRVEDVPPRLALVAGDVVHNLRSTLDYLAWQLVLISPPAVPSERTQFPVRWDRPVKYDAHGIPILMEPQPHPDIVRTLDGLQPYKSAAPRSHPLFVLHDLDRIDKHRHLSVLAQAVASSSASILLPNGRGVGSGRGGSGVAFEDGAVLASFSRFQVDDVPYSEVNVNCKLEVRVTLGELGPTNERVPSISEQLGALVYFLRNEVLPAFEPFFP